MLSRKDSLGMRRNHSGMKAVFDAYGKAAGRACLCLILAGACFVLGSKRAAADSAADASIGVISTSEQKWLTRITYLDDEMKETGERDYPYAGVSLDGYQNICRADDRIFLYARGGSRKAEDGLIFSLSLQDGSVKEYDFDRVNILSFCVEGDYIYTVSNLNWTCYADRMSVKDGTRTFVDSTEVILDNTAVVDGMLYSLGYDEDNANCLFRVNFEQNRIEKLLTLDCVDLPVFLVTYKDFLIYTCDGMLFLYDVLTGDLEEVPLSGEDACHLNVCGDLLYIGYTSLFSEGEDSRVELYDLKKRRVTGSFSHSGPILQIEPGDPDGGNVWVCGYEGVTGYELSGDTGTAVRYAAFASDETLYPGGFFPMERGHTE